MTLLSQLDLELKAYNDPVVFCNEILHIKPYPMQAEILRKFYMTKTPDLYTHLVLVTGMRSGKTQLGAMASTYELFKLILKGDPQKYYELPPGQPIYILHVANCLHPETPIITNKGWVEIQHIKAGDMVYTKAGQFSPVSNTFSRNLEPHEKMLEINAVGCMPFKVSGNHEVLAVRSKFCNKVNGICKPRKDIRCNDCTGHKREVEWIPAADLKEGDFVVDKIPISKATPLVESSPIKFKNYTAKRKLQYTATHLLSQSPDFWYLIGAYLAEGCVTGSRIYWTPGSHEKKFINTILSSISKYFDGKIQHHTQNHNESGYVIYINNRYMAALFEKLFGKTSDKKHIPAELIHYLQEEQIVALLRGYLDGDGHYSTQYIKAGTVSSNLHTSIYHLCARIGIICGVHKRESSYGFSENALPIYEIIISGEDIQRIYGPTPTRQCKHCFIENGYILKPIKQITQLNYSDVVYDIEVPNASSFAVPYCIVHNSREQAKNTIFAQTAGLLEHSDWFAEHGLQERHNEFSFPDYGLVLACEHSNSAALAGRTAKAVILDETARFKDTAGKFSGAAVYYTVSRAVKTFGTEGKVFSVSSPISVDDFQMQLYNSGLKLDNFLCYKKATWEMNPRITQKSLKPEFLLNPETAWRDYGAIPSMAQEAYFGNQYAINEAFHSSLPQIIENDQLISGLMPKPDTYYYLAGDPAVKNDAFGICLLHQEGKTIIVDFVHRFIQQDITAGGNREVDAFAVKEFVLNVANIFPLRSFMVDTWQFPETIQAMEHAGVYVKQHTVKKQEYDCLKEQIYTHNIKIPVSGKLNEELKQLELLHGTRVDHPKTGSKDMADSLANAVWELIQESGDKPEVWNAHSKKGAFYGKINTLPRLLPIDEAEFHEFDIY